MKANKEARGREPVTDCGKIRTDGFMVHVRLESPMHLGSGKADVNVDAEVVHDRWGLPYFPAKRFKGLLYESAMEVTEILAACGADRFKQKDVDQLFQHGCSTETQLIIPNLYLADYEAICQEWQLLEQEYGEVFQPLDVLGQYTSLRYQTRIDRKTGTAADTSLHNLRVVGAGLEFYGQVRLLGGTLQQLMLLSLAMKNLTAAGGKRNRGFGEISCRMEQDGRDIQTILIGTALKEGVLA